MGWLSSLVGATVGFLVGGPAGAVIGAGIGATKVGEKAVNAVMDFVLQPFMPDIPEVGGGTEADRQQGVLIQRSGSVQQIPVIYGYRKTGSVVTFVETGSTNNKYLYVAYVFSEGLVEGLREVYIDDWLLPSDQVGALNAGSLVTVNADRYKDRVQLRWFPGTYFTNPASSTVGSTVKSDIFKDAPSFTSNMNYNGLAVLFARYEWKEIKTQADSDSNPFSGNVPEVQVAMLGKRVASLLTDETQTTSYDANVIRYSTNPAECLLDYLRNPRYGKGLNNDDIDWYSWKVAARKCNQTVTYVASGIQGPILTLNYVLTTDKTVMANTKDILTNFRAYMPYVQGKYKLKIEDAGNPTDILSGAAVINQTFTKDDIVSDVTYMGIDKSSKYNVVSVTYVDPDQKFSNQTVVYPETEGERQIYIDRDGGRENKYDVTYGGITNYAIAKDMARLIFNKQRRQESCVFTATSKALELEPGDCIRIQSNILNFGTDPWRVISIKINNDMTVDLGCVRNPDDIYPYVRVGEEDIVLPTYIPKGSIIYYPSSDNRVPLGLVPPMFAVFPPSTAGSSTNPTPTDPLAPGGGGVGGGTTDSAAVGTTTTPVSTTNTPPGSRLPDQRFAVVLTYVRTDAPKLPNGNFNYTVVFKQPDSGAYSYSTMWWRLNKYSAWREVRVDQKPGAGGEISIVLGELPKGIYDWYVRCYATDGTGSINQLQGQSYLVETGSPGNFVGTGSANNITAEGFTLPASQVPTVPKYDSDIDYIEVRPQLSGGSPLSTRRMKLKIQQIQDITSTAINPLVSGFKIFYRLKGDTYWSFETFVFPQSYVPGQIYEVNLLGDFGSRVYPSDIVPNTSNAALQQYEFMARLTYADGTAPLKQVAPAVGRVELSATGLYDFVVWGRRLMNLTATAFLPDSASVENQTITADFNTNFKTVDQAPAGSVAGLDIVAAISSIQSYASTNRLDWFLIQPNSSKFRGYKIRWREVQSGTDPDFNEWTTSSAADPSGYIYWRMVTPSFAYNKLYDFVITAQILDSTTNTMVDATNSLVSRIRVLNNDPEYSNLYTKFNFTTTTTVAALKQLQDAFPSDPVANVRSWTKVIPKAWSGAGPFGATGEFETVGTSSDPGYAAYLNHYYKASMQVPTSTVAIIVYRRVYSIDGAGRSSVTSLAKYDGVGPWERVRIPKADLTPTDGWYTINLRGAIEPSQWFDPYYEVSGYSGRTLKWAPGSRFPTFSPYFPNGTASYKLSDIRPYYGAGNDDIAATKYVQYLIVLEDSTGELNKGILLRSFYTINNGTAWKENREGFVEGNVSAQTIEDLDASFNTPFTAGYERRLSESITAVAVDKLYNNSYGLPKINATYTAYTKFFQGPRNGSTIY